MAKINTQQNTGGNKHSTTSIGKSPNTNPKNKHAKRNHKSYRGQGKPQ